MNFKIDLKCIIRPIQFFRVVPKPLKDEKLIHDGEQNRTIIYNLRFARKAFTIVELIVTIAIIAVILGFGVVNIIRFAENQNFKQDAESIVEGIRFAQGKAELGEGGVDWGIKFTSLANDGYFEIFSGSSYSTSTVVVRRQISGSSLYTNPAPGNTKTILFSAITGLPSLAHTIVIKKNSFDDEVYIISVSALGRVNAKKETGLVGYWTFDEGSGDTVYDASGNGNNGTWSGSGSRYSGGKIGSHAGQFVDATNDYITITGSVTSLASSNLDDEVTISFFMKASNTGQADWVRIVKKSDIYEINSVNRFMVTKISTTDGILTRLDTDVGGGSFNQNMYLTGTVFDDIWHHIVFIVSNGQIYGYVDGTERSFQYGNTYNHGTGFGNSEPIYIAEGTFTGLLDDMRIYNRALATSEVESIYESY